MTTLLRSADLFIVMVTTKTTTLLSVSVIKADVLSSHPSSSTSPPTWTVSLYNNITWLPLLLPSRPLRGLNINTGSANDRCWQNSREDSFHKLCPSYNCSSSLARYPFTVTVTVFSRPTPWVITVGIYSIANCHPTWSKCGAGFHIIKRSAHPRYKTTDSVPAPCRLWLFLLKLWDIFSPQPQKPQEHLPHLLMQTPPCQQSDSLQHNSNCSLLPSAFLFRP